MKAPNTEMLDHLFFSFFFPLKSGSLTGLVPKITLLLVAIEMYDESKVSDRIIKAGFTKRRSLLLAKLTTK